MSPKYTQNGSKIIIMATNIGPLAANGLIFWYQQLGGANSHVWACPSSKRPFFGPVFFLRVKNRSKYVLFAIPKWPKGPNGMCIGTKNTLILFPEFRGFQKGIIHKGPTTEMKLC